MRARELIFENKELDEGPLTGYQLTHHSRYDGRFDVIVDKITKGSPFELVSGGQVVLKKDPDIINLFKNRQWNDFKKIYKSYFEDVDGNKIHITSLKKTTEFGGVESGKFLAKENFAIADLNEKLQEIFSESGATSIDIKIQNNLYTNIVKAESTPKTPKSDFSLINADGEQVVWISHKDGTDAKGFQQWGGITGAESRDSAEVKEFVKLINAELENQNLTEFPRKQTWAVPLSNPELALKAVYGKDFGSNFGINNVQLVIQGLANLIPLKNYYTLDSHRVLYNGQVPTDGYTPMLMVRYLSDRANLGIRFARASISPQDSRKIHKFLTK